MAGPRIGIVILLATAAMAVGQGPGKPKIHVAKSNGEKVIGSLNWVITEGKKVIGKGRKQVRLKDVALLDYGGNYIRAEVKLSNHFVLGLPMETDLGRGFGVTVDRDDIDTFSWEWFSIQSPGRAEKLQETGELAFTKAKTGAISKLTFFTDISMRLRPMSDPPSASDRWRVKIFKGSNITWPSLVNGKVVAN